MGNDISVILIQEIWDVSLESLFKIEDYELFVNMRESSKGGGVDIYCKTYLKPSLLPDLKIMNEAFAIEIFLEGTFMFLGLIIDRINMSHPTILLYLLVVNGYLMNILSSGFFPH